MSDNNIPRHDPSFEVARSLGRIEGRLEQALGIQTNQGQVLENHEKRIGTLETKSEVKKAWGAGAYWAVAGIVTTFGTLASVVAGVWK
jgi:hypothetical protein